MPAFSAEADPPEMRTPRLGWLHLIAVVVAFLVLFARHPDMLLTPYLQWEDARIFLSEGIRSAPFSTCFVPFTGYFHLLPKLVASFFDPISIIHAPFYFNLIALVTMALGFTVILSPVCDRWMPLWARGLVCVLIVLLPWRNPTYGMLTDLHWYLFPALCVLSLADLDRVGKRWRWVLPTILFPIVFTTPNVILVLPVVGVRLLFGFRKRDYSFFVFAWLVGLIGMKLAAIHFLTPLSSDHLQVDFSALMVFLAKGIGFKTVLKGVFGGIYAKLHLQSTVWTWLGCAFFGFLICAIGLLQRSERDRIAGFRTVASVYYLVAPMLLAGFYRPNYVKHFVAEDNYWGADRYFITPALFFIILVVTFVVACIRRWPATRWVFAALLVIYSTVLVDEFDYRPVPGRDWERNLANYYESLLLYEGAGSDADFVLIPTHPGTPDWVLNAPLFQPSAEERRRIEAHLRTLENEINQRRLEEPGEGEVDGPTPLGDEVRSTLPG